jgi:hypothetical protein
MDLKDLPVGQKGYVSCGSIVPIGGAHFEVSKYTVCKPVPYGPFTVMVVAHKDLNGNRFYHAYYLDEIYNVSDFYVVVEYDSWWVDNFVKVAVITAIVISIAYLILRNS